MKRKPGRPRKNVDQSTKVYTKPSVRYVTYSMSSGRRTVLEGESAAELHRKVTS